MSDYIVGQTVRLRFEIRDDLLGLANPSGTVTLTVQLPDQITTATPTVVNDSLGKYHADYVPTVAGPYEWHVHSTGTPQVDRGGSFSVDPIFGQQQLVTLDEVKAHLNYLSIAVGSTHEGELEWMIGAATKVIEDHGGSGIGPVLRRTITNERHHHDYGRANIWLHHTPILSVTTVTPVATGGTAVTVADLDVDPNGRVAYKDGYTRFPTGVYLWTYVAGRDIDDAIKGAALILIQGLWETQRGASGVPYQGGAEEIAGAPGMGLYLWRADMLLKTHARAPGVA